MAWRDKILGHPFRDGLPERIARAISAQESQSEILIGWAQLAIGLVWAALYILAPRPLDAGMAFEPVPLALGFYLAFSTVRLVLVHRHIAPTWFLALSVIVDMIVVMALIWSFHLQYDQPASFYLKAPTLMYVFIFIALRALRFSAGFVLLAGLTAALGWLVLVHYALMTSTEPDMGVTRDYVEYLTSNQILIGAEFDKVIAILLSTGILAVAIVRARRTLVAAAVEGAAHSDLSRFFAPEVAHQITQAEHRIEPGEGESREAAALLCDIRGFTPLAMQISPRDLMALLADYQGRMVTVIERHGGSIDKFLGDGIMATFGAALPTETFAADALRAIEELDATVTAWNAERAQNGQPELRVGFATAAGPVVFGAVGDRNRLEFTVIGEPVNLAAKLEDANKSENTRGLTTAATLALAERQGYAPGRKIEIRQARPVRGIDAPLDLAVLLD